MWDEPYLETCCRAALHRLALVGGAGRPAGLADQPCLLRLQGMGFCAEGTDSRFRITPVGEQRHASEVLKKKPA